MPTASRSSSSCPQSSSSFHNRSASRPTRRRNHAASAAFDDDSATEQVRLSAGRDSLVADLYWTFHGENAIKYSDVTLISKDNRQFPCCRGILAARSDYFAKLLFSDQQRHAASINPDNTQPNRSAKLGSNDKVPVDLLGDVLALVIQYLHTGDIANDDSFDRDALDRLIEVARAAHKMSHSTMFADSIAKLLNVVTSNPAMLCPVFDAFFGMNRLEEASSLLAPLLQHVRRDPSSTLLLPDVGATAAKSTPSGSRLIGPMGSSTSSASIATTTTSSFTASLVSSSDDLRPPVATGGGVGEVVGVLELSGRALETLVCEDKNPENAGDDLHEEFWFYVIWYWAIHGSNSAVNNTTTTTTTGTTVTTSSQDGTGTAASVSALDEANLNLKSLSVDAIARRTHATQIIDILDARRMRAAFLLRVVEPTGLMSLQKLCDGYKAHATRPPVRSVDRVRKRLRFRARPAALK